MNKKFTIVVSHFVIKDKDNVFNQLLERVTSQASKFKGYQSIQIIKPRNNEENEYLLIIRFDKEKYYTLWTSSVEYKTWVNALSHLVHKKSDVHFHDSLEFWFNETNNNKTPKKWKMSILAWCAAFPIILTFSYLLQVIVPDLSVVIKMLIISICLISGMTYIIMPKLTQLFNKWIY